VSPVEFGAHLPLIAFDGRPRTLPELCAYARRAAALGFTSLCANDHLLYHRPWLDGPTALSAVLEASAGMSIATTVALPVVRGPVATAKTLATLDRLSGGRLVAGVGPGSSAADYAAVGVPFDERWPRFEEAVRTLRALLTPGAEPVAGRWYATSGVTLDPPPARDDGVPLWIGSWGSPAGLRRVARLGDGWLASGYNTTPATFADASAALAGHLAGAGRDAAAFPHAIATMWLCVTATQRDADRVIDDVLAPALRRSPEAVRELALPIGPPERCAERIAAWAAAGAQRIFLWPLRDEVRQLERFRDDVLPLVTGR
jgi:alkanesulfonate monooxygenase SsuD/methylene tetrahydromethanopterin reductase-like flavin-dependent oxidoreductase (luciferase family)